MSIKLWPTEFEKKEHISREEKMLLRYVLRNFAEGHFVVGIDPLGMSTDKVHMGLYIAPKKGLITFSIFKESINPRDINKYISAIELIEKKIYNRLLDSKSLIVRNNNNKMLKFPYKHIILFENEKTIEIKEDGSTFEPVENHVYMQNFSSVNKDRIIFMTEESDLFTDCRMPYDENFKEITELESKAIFERLAPEYTVIIHEKNNIDLEVTTTQLEDDKINDEDFLITGKENEYKTFFLDEYQVAQVNDIGKGHRVILANPGAGKSVLLLSKAFKYASLYKNSKVLLTCYNNNLADSYNFKKACANFGDNKNLYIFTLHSLAKILYEEVLKKKIFGDYASDDEIKEIIEAVKKGKITMRFKAIFIDEVQIFDPLYLELCYNMLEKDENSTFLMAGDLNQTVRSQSRKGDAPWKRINGVNLDFTGRVKYIEKNYRNSKEIGEYLNNMLCLMNEYLSKLKMISLDEYTYDSFESGDRKGVEPKIVTGIKRKNIQEKIIEAVKEIVSKYNVGYSDIAILFPYKDFKSLDYHFEYWVTSAFDKEGIPYSFITKPSNDRHKKVKYSATKGIVLSTIDSSLGLDFKAVILAGLYPYNYVLDNNKRILLDNWGRISLFGEQLKETFKIQMRKVYTASSRARDILYVLSDLSVGSPIESVLIGAKKNDE